MNTFHTIAEFRAWRRTVAPNVLTPFVPTMGALHEGHASLVRQARRLAGAKGRVIASIFVNPTQFGPNEDYNKYPRTLDADLQMLTAAGCDAVFVPSAQEMYPNLGAHDHGAITIDTFVDPGPLSEILEGAIRPGHFRGVCTVVAKLLNITQPTHMLMGQKDFQQQAILRQMCRDLNMPVEVVTCPTIRESDGLAMSSRNRYLSAEERPKAIGLSQALTRAKSLLAAGNRNAPELELAMKTQMESCGLIVQYVVVAHSQTLALWSNAAQGLITGPAVALVAAKLGNTRLIDNMILHE